VTGRPAVILDRDGVLNEKPPRAQYVRKWEEWRWIPGSLDGLAALTAAGKRVFVVSNQAGVARGAMSADDLVEIHRRMLEDVASAGARIDGIYTCPHDWDAGCDCRKPAPGMLIQAQRDHALDLSKTPFIGDDERDAEAADAAGCPSLMVTADVPFRDVVDRLLSRQPDMAVA
jgi:D-glycero-D-manno-heptose 1,7-bisphosphate phosphatase